MLFYFRKESVLQRVCTGGLSRGGTPHRCFPSATIGSARVILPSVTATRPALRSVTGTHTYKVHVSHAVLGNGQGLYAVSTTQTT